MCNFIESDGSHWGKGIFITFIVSSFLIIVSGDKLVYRHYATLYFIFVVDSSESELAILDIIQTFVETLDVFFRNVCELDLIFNMDKVHYVLDEIIQGGMVIETKKEDILRSCNEMTKLEKTDNGSNDKFVK